MLTIFTCPKPFVGHIRIIQRNAIQSWLAQKKGVEIILIGEEDGIAETVSEFGLIHIPKVECNEYGTPLISSIFSVAQEKANYELLCYINTDILLFGDFISTIANITFPNYLLVGRRWELDISEKIDFHKNGWDEDIKALVQKEGKLDGPRSIDYFVFKRGAVKQMPPFAVGRPWWDNWLIYYFWKTKVTIVDATATITAVHQKHTYNHVKSRMGSRWEGPEADKNIALIGVVKKLSFSVDDASYFTTSAGLQYAYTKPYVRRKWKRLPLLYPWLSPLHRFISRLIHAIHKVI